MSLESRWYRLLSLFTIVAVVTACNYRQDKSGSSPVIMGGEISFSVVQAEIFQKRCVSCHGDFSRIALINYEQIILRLKDIERVALRDRTMPPRDPLTNNESALLAQWVAQVNSPNPPPPHEPSPTPVPPPLLPNFDSIKQNVLIPRNCIGCHSHGQPGKLVPLNTKEDLINSPRFLVVPGNAEESGLILALIRTDEKRMPPPATGMPTVPDSEIAVIKKWIDEGAE